MLEVLWRDHPAGLGLEGARLDVALRLCQVRLRLIDPAREAVSKVTRTGR